MIQIPYPFLLYVVINLDGQGGGEDVGPNALVARGTLATDKSPGEPLVHQEGPRHVISRGWRNKLIDVVPRHAIQCYGGWKANTICDVRCGNRICLDYLSFLYF